MSPVDASANSTVPVWTLLTTDVAMPVLADGEPMTSQRLDSLRTAMAALAQTPIATLEVHRLPNDLDTSGGMRLASSSPLAQQLTRLIANSLQSSSAESPAETAMEALFRMVIPGEAAAQMGSGLIRPRPKKGGPTTRKSTAANQGAGIGALANLVPAAGGAGLTPVVAGSLILMTVAAGVLVVDRIDRQFKGITDLLEQLHEVALEAERIELDSSRPAITKATALLLDRGRIGEAVALGGAVTHIEKAISAANRRLARWQNSLKSFRGRKVEFTAVRNAFKGIESPAGEFHAHLELALLAIDLKRRVLLLQAVEQAQTDPDNPFERFMETLQHDQQSLEKLASGINAVLVRMSELQVDRTHGLRDFMFTAGEVDDLLQTSQQLRKLDRYTTSEASRSLGDIAIEIARNADGSVVVFPASEA